MHTVPLGVTVEFAPCVGVEGQKPQPRRLSGRPPYQLNAALVLVIHVILDVICIQNSVAKPYLYPQSPIEVKYE
jgi:hypothetical protein